MGRTRAIHLIWTGYGTWLPGDHAKPGHWSPLFDLYGRITRAGHQLNMPDATTYQHARELMHEPPKLLADDEPALVADVLSRHLAPAHPGVAEVSAQSSLPTAHACAIEPNHVHLLLGPVDEAIDRPVGRLKGTTSSALLKHPNNWERKRVWSTGYWKVFLFDDAATMIVQDYIQAHNIRNGLPPSPYAWLRPT